MSNIIKKIDDQIEALKKDQQSHDAKTSVVGVDVACGWIITELKKIREGARGT